MKELFNGWIQKEYVDDWGDPSPDKRYMIKTFEMSYPNSSDNYTSEIEILFDGNFAFYLETPQFSEDAEYAIQLFDSHGESTTVIGKMGANKRSIRIYTNYTDSLLSLFCDNGTVKVKIYYIGLTRLRNPNRSPELKNTAKWDLSGFKESLKFFWGI